MYLFFSKVHLKQREESRLFSQDTFLNVAWLRFWHLESKHYKLCIFANRKRQLHNFSITEGSTPKLTQFSLVGGWNLFSTIILCRAVLERVSSLLYQYPPLSISWQNFPFISNCTEKIIVCSETGLYLNKVKNRSATRTCVA